MSTYIGEIQLFAGNFAPGGFFFCDGRLLPIGQYTSLFSLIGTHYGGDGQSTFALPDLGARVAIHEGQGPGLSMRALGQSGGSASVTLTAGQVPPHLHNLLGSTGSPLAQNSGVLAAGLAYAPAGTGSQVPLSGMTVETTPPQPAQPHENRQPYLVLNYIICYNGVYPSRS